MPLNTSPPLLTLGWTFQSISDWRLKTSAEATMEKKKQGWIKCFTIHQRCSNTMKTVGNIEAKNALKSKNTVLMWCKWSQVSKCKVISVKTTACISSALQNQTPHHCSISATIQLAEEKAFYLWTQLFQPGFSLWICRHGGPARHRGQFSMYGQPSASRRLQSIKASLWPMYL